jgi:hypothetical protein
MSRMTRRRKLALVGGIAAFALVVGGLGAAGAIAASGLLSPDDQSSAIIDDAAKQLGVEPDALSDALKQAFKNRIDEAVKAGRLTEEQGDELKERIDSNDYPRLFGHGGAPGGARLFHRGLGPFSRGLDAAASYLGMTEAELREALRDSTLAEIAKDKGKSVDGLVNALVATQEQRIDQAVKDGRLTKQQAADFKARLNEQVEALVNGEFRGPRLGMRPRMWRGSAAPRAPPSFFGPSA